MKKLENRGVKLVERSLALTLQAFRKHAHTLHQCAESGGNELVTAEAAQQLAEEYEEQITELRRLQEWFAGVVEVLGVGL